jgi:hypothetical protein
MAVTGTFAARAPTYLKEASQLMTTGMVTQPYATYSDGTVIGGADQASAPAGWSPDPRSWGSPMDAVNGAKRMASNADQSAIDNTLTPGVTPAPSGTNESIDGQWQVGANGEAVFVTRDNGGMKWWHWGLIGAAVLGGGYALTRIFAR